AASMASPARRRGIFRICHALSIERAPTAPRRLPARADAVFEDEPVEMPVHPRVLRQRTLKEVLNGRVVREIVSEASEQPPCVGVHDEARTEKGVDEDDVCRLRAHAADGEQFFAQFFRRYARGVLPLKAVFPEPR